MGDQLASQTSCTLLELLKDPANLAAWGLFADRYRGAIFAWCRKRGLQEADAEDVTQKLLLEIHRKIKNFVYQPSRGRFRGWLRTVTHNAVKDYLKDLQRHVAAGDNRVLEVLDSVEAGDDLGKELEREYDHELLATAMARVQPRVSPRDWRIFNDLALGERSGDELARELGMSVAAVLMVKSRVLGKLKKEKQRLEGTHP